MPIPNKTDFTGSSVTEGGFKTALDALIDFLGQAIGTIDGYLRIARGTTAAKPTPTEGGWFRWDTDLLEMEISYGTAWQQLLRSTPDATWKWNLNVGNSISGMRVFNASAAGCKTRVEMAGGSYVEMGVDSDEFYLLTAGTKPFRIWINGAPVMKIDSAGNLTTIGTITQRGTV